MSDHPTAAAGVRRAAVLAEFDLMGTPPSEKFDRITRLARRLLGVPLSFLNLIDEQHVYAKSTAPTGRNVLAPKEASFCVRTIERPEPMIVPDATLDDRFADLGVVVGDPHVRFYAGAPITIHGTAIGSICVADIAPRTLSDEEIATLEELARWVERSILEDLDRRNAAMTQRMLQPPAIRTAGFRVDGLSFPAGSVCGDCGTWAPTDGGCMVALADVMGKGTGAGIIAASLRGAVLARARADLTTAMRETAQQFARELDAVGSFATLFWAQLDYASGIVRYIDAGHGLAVHVTAAGETALLPATTLPLGLTPDTEDFAVSTITLEPGDRLVVMSDGLLELPDPPLTTLHEIADLAKTCDDVTEFLAAIREDVGDRQLDDDVTVVVIQRDA